MNTIFFAQCERIFRSSMPPPQPSPAREEGMGRGRPAITLFAKVKCHSRLNLHIQLSVG